MAKSASKTSRKKKSASNSAASKSSGSKKADKPKIAAAKSSSSNKHSKKITTSDKKSSVSKSQKLPYHSLKDFQVTVRDEIRNLHDATESFVRLAVNKAIETDHVKKIEQHVLEIGKNIDELEDMLFKLSLKSK